MDAIKIECCLKILRADAAMTPNFKPMMLQRVARCNEHLRDMKSGDGRISMIAEEKQAWISAYQHVLNKSKFKTMQSQIIIGAVVELVLACQP